MPRTRATRLPTLAAVVAEILNDLAAYPTVLVVADVAKLLRMSAGRVRLDAPTGSEKVPPGWRSSGDHGSWRWLKTDVATFLARKRLKMLRRQQRLGR